jgi:lipopolysaccharide assembly outer membrane protein LptD (OstA)
MGDFGTIFQWNPFPDFSATTDLLVDVGGGSISRFSTRLDYSITEDWKVFAGYFYQNDYTQRSVYSMGSSLTDITSGSSFTRSYGKRQSIFGGLEFPIIDDKTRGTVSMYYDLDDNMINEARVGVIRKFHCWEAGVEWRVKERNDDVGEREWENTFMFTLSLTDLPSVKIAAKGGPSN